MSKSLKRVRAAILDAGLEDTIRETGHATTAQMAADELGCTVDQIVKSIIFLGETSGRCVLFLTSGGNQVDSVKASALAGEPLGKADAAMIRAQTGFAIGGVSPLGHLTPPRAFFDPALMDFSEIWGAAGTPRHVFKASPQDVLKHSGATLAEFT
ncbi:YbaK/EbsC family protein [Planktotalea sp.]|uniref:YbaK/EbsC family protein n=1 Tax=Planktotalea sp. TaxID=2029877 RepID=UPI003D6A66B6